MNMKLVLALVTAGAVSTAAIAARAERPENHGSRGCSEETLRGAYGFQFQGTRPVHPPFPAGVESFAAIAIRTYDGAGSFTQVTTTRGTVVGVDQNVTTGGTYAVNEGLRRFRRGPNARRRQHRPVCHRR
ncbi:MAG: hypothetical protein ABJA98_33095 [Acidobacteriota bacterium]